MNIKTEFVHPPIPIRQYDWTAIDADTYCCGECSPIGTGPTEESAIEDLMEQLND